MLNFITPVVFFCAVVSGSKTACDGHTSLTHEELTPVSTPMQCLLDGTSYATQYIVEFEKWHLNEKLEYRIVCKSSEKT